MLDRLLALVTGLGHWSYLILFAAAALECAAFVGLFVPGESLVLASGFLSHQGVLELGPVMATVAVGAVVGDTIGFQLGTRLGRGWLLRHGRRLGVTPARLGRAERFFERHGPKAVFVGRFVGFARALVPFVAGTSGMNYGRFLAYNVLGAVLWTVTFVLLGYLVGASWRVAERWIGRGSLILGIVVAAVLLMLWRRRRVSPPRTNC